MMSTSNVSASEGCGVYTEEDLAFYESLNRPDIYDLSCSNGTPFTNEYLETLNQDPNVMTRRYFANKIDVPAFEQLPNYCGPASMKQAIHAIRGTSSSQEYYGTLVGTNTSAGTDLKNQLRQLKLLIADFLHLLQEKKR